MAEVRFFAAAAEAAGTSHESVSAPTLGALRDSLIARHGTEFARVLGRCSILIDGVSTESADAPLAKTSLVDVLPPFAGG